MDNGQRLWLKRRKWVLMIARLQQPEIHQFGSAASAGWNKALPFRMPNNLDRDQRCPKNFSKSVLAQTTFNFYLENWILKSEASFYP